MTILFFTFLFWYSIWDVKWDRPAQFIFMPNLQVNLQFHENVLWIKSVMVRRPDLCTHLFERTSVCFRWTRFLLIHYSPPRSWAFIQKGYTLAPGPGETNYYFNSVKSLVSRKSPCSYQQCVLNVYFLHRELLRSSVFKALWFYKACTFLR